MLYVSYWHKVYDMQACIAYRAHTFIVHRFPFEKSALMCRRRRRFACNACMWIFQKTIQSKYSVHVALITTDDTFNGSFDVCRFVRASPSIIMYFIYTQTCALANEFVTANSEIVMLHCQCNVNDKRSNKMSDLLYVQCERSDYLVAARVENRKNFMKCHKMWGVSLLDAPSFSYNSKTIARRNPMASIQCAVVS